MIGLILPAIIFAIGWLLFKSDNKNKTIITHKDFMDKFKSKEQVIKEFGLPDSNKDFNNFTEWYYDKGTKYKKVSNREFGSDDILVGGIGKYKKVGLAGGFKTNFGNEHTTEEIIEDKTFIKFIFDKDVVVNWETKGVDFYSEF
jgi:hypothetical protein